MMGHIPHLDVMTSSGRAGPGRYIGVDVGQSGIRAVVADGSRRDVRHADEGMSATVDAAGVDRLVRALAILVGGESADACAIGLTGYTHDPPLLRRLRSDVGGAVGASRVVVASDVVTAYVGALGSIPGVAVIWGTGTVALAGNGHGGWQRVDGRGHALGDHGSGYWIGQRGLAAALDHTDGRGGSRALADKASRLGTPAEIYRRIYGAASVTQAVAAFAVAVVEAAGEGDATAAQILDAAAGEVAVTVSSAAARVLDAQARRSVSVTGGVGQAPGMADRLARLLQHAPAEADVAVVDDAPLHGALRLAAEPALASPFPGLALLPGEA